jgi:hydroxyethylthiazole kinase-like uncharacterized protein yjeF
MKGNEGPDGTDGAVDACAIELLTTAEMGRADRMTAEAGTPSFALMEMAGAAVAREVLARFARAGRVAVLCGPGNNGGDGFVLARRLRDAGLDPRIWLLGARDALKGDAALAAAAWQGPAAPLSELDLDGADLVVDALFGAGLGRPLEGAARRAVEAANSSGLPILAVDLPSGIDGDSGAVLGAAIRARATVTFFRLKPGHLLQPGREHAGETVVADIGISDRVLDAIRPAAFRNLPPLWEKNLRWPEPLGHKYSRGHAVVVGGPRTRTGAARLAARGALRAGAGLVTVACPADALEIYAAQLTAVMVEPWRDLGELRAFLADERLNALCIGPGAGRGGTAEAVTALLALGRPMLLDADALTCFEAQPDELLAALAARDVPAVLTPHEGEFRRVFGAHAAEDGPDRTDKLRRARRAAERARSVVVLKGSDTVVAAPDGRAAVAANAPPWLATAGSGDVLAGFILGLLAQGMAPFEAAAAGVWLHGEAACAFGPGLIAEDLSEALPGVLSRLAARRETPKF